MSAHHRLPLSSERGLESQNLDLEYVVVLTGTFLCSYGIAYRRAHGWLLFCSSSLGSGQDDVSPCDICLKPVLEQADGLFTEHAVLEQADGLFTSPIAAVAATTKVSPHQHISHKRNYRSQALTRRI